MKTVMYILTDVGLGGSAQSLMDMLKGIKYRIRPVVVIPRDGLIESYLQQLEVKYYKIPFSIKFCKIGKGSRQLEDDIFREDYFAALQLLPVIEKEKVDLLHTNSSVCNVGAIAALLSGKPHVWHLRELLEEHFGCEFIDGKFKRELFNYTDTFIAISNCVRNVYKHRFGIDSFCIYNGFDIEKFISNEPYYDRGNSFLLAGRISDGKGQWDAVQAVELLLNQGWSDIFLTIVGDSEQKMIWSIKKYIKGHGLDEYICVLPFQRNLSDLRKKHTYALTCSKMEALGRTTVEAMLFGNIVIGADTGGTLEIIGEHSERGYLYRQGDYVDLAEVMKQVMSEGVQEKILKSKSAKQYAQKTFNSSIYITEMEKLYEEVIGRNKKGTDEEKNRLLGVMRRRYSEIANKERTEKNLYGENKFKLMFQYTELWLRLKQQGRSLTEFFTKRGIHHIGIYGMGFLGCDLYDELEGNEIEILYVMDQSPETIDKIIPVKKLDEHLPAVDAIVITAISGENEIQEMLKKKCPYTIIKLSEIIELSVRDI